MAEIRVTTPRDVAAETAALIEPMVAAYGQKPGAFLAVLEQLQNAHPSHYLSPEVVQEAARQLNVPPSQAYSVVTFYAFFNRTPQGRHTITICRGTACHTRGSRVLLESVRSALQLPETTDADEKNSQTSADRQFTVRTVACFGQCALAPVVEFGRVIHGHMNRQKILSALQQMSGSGAR